MLLPGQGGAALQRGEGGEGGGPPQGNLLLGTLVMGPSGGPVPRAPTRGSDEG